MSKKIETIKDLTPDAANANKHSQRGMGMMQTSIEECGFGDSLTVDKNGNVISGNGRLETLADLQMLDAIVVQSDGTRPVVHQRTDLDLTIDAKAKRLAILQNRVGQVNLEWDTDALAQMAADGVELDDLWSDEELTALLNDGRDDGLRRVVSREDLNGWNQELADAVADLRLATSGIVEVA